MIQRITIPYNHVGVSMKDGRVDEVYTEGRYWVGSSAQVTVFDQSKAFEPKCGLEIALQNPALANLLDVYDIADNEAGLRFRNGRFEEVLLPGQYAYWKNSLFKFSIEKQNINEAIVSSVELDTLLRQTAFLQHVRIFNVGEQEIGLMYTNGKFVRLLPTGKYAFWKSASHVQVVAQNTNVCIASNEPLKVLLQYPEMANQLQVFEIAENEIALLYADGRCVQVLEAGQFGYWSAAKRFEITRVHLDTLEVEATIDRNLIQKGLLDRFVRGFTIETYEQGILFVNGQMERIVAPGVYYFWKNATQVAVQKADMRQMVLEVSGQEILTKDKAQLRINFMVQYRVSDLVKALTANKDYEKQLYTQMQLVLRELVGQLSFDELMESKDELAQKATTEAKNKAYELGITLFDFGIKDIILPGDVKEIMNQVLIAEKRAQANVITRREETASMRSLLNTAKLMEENAMLMKLKEMEYVEKIAEKIQTISLSGSGQVVDQLKQLFVK